jgi:DegV family protein with EDD domain
MNKIALVTDSTSDLLQADIDRYDIHVLPLRIVYKNREYIDRVDITPEEVYSRMPKEVPSTSLPSMEDLHKLFKELTEQGYTQAIIICISSGLSGTYNIVSLVSRDYPSIECFIFDSKALSMATGAIVIECAQMIEAGETFEKIKEKLPSIRSNIKVYFILDTLTYLIKGGRIGKVSGVLGEILSIKPIISINDEGVYYTYARVRGRRQSLDRLFEIVKESLEKSKSKIWIMHGDALKEAKALYDNVLNLPNLLEIGLGSIGPVLGVHTGVGTLGVIVIKEND